MEPLKLSIGVALAGQMDRHLPQLEELIIHTCQPEDVLPELRKHRLRCPYVTVNGVEL